MGPLATLDPMSTVAPMGRAAICPPPTGGGGGKSNDLLLAHPQWVGMGRAVICPLVGVESVECSPLEGSRPGPVLEWKGRLHSLGHASLEGVQTFTEN